MNILSCNWDTAKFLIFSGNVFGVFIYYSHFFALIPSFVIGLIIFLKDRKALVNQILFFITSVFSLWVFADLVLWANEKPSLIMFFWSLQVIIEPLIYAACVYFVDVFITKKDISFKKKMGIAILLLPTLLFASTKFALIGFNFANCDRETVEGIVTLYGYFIEIVYALWILFYALKKYRQSTLEIKKHILFITSGIMLFLLSFASGNIIGSLTDNWTLAQIGLFGMPIFVAFLAYIIVKFKAFNIKLIGAEALVFILGFLVLAIAFIRRIENVRVIVIFTFLFVIALGYALIKSVKKEVEQKEQLAALLQQRENLVHLVTHKVKGSFTRSKYIFAEILEGTFGPISPKIKSITEQGLASDNEGIATVDLVLNAANMQKGTIKYEMKPVDFKEIVFSIISQKKGPAELKGLKLETDIRDGNYIVPGDEFWLKEVVLNLVDNAVKYTEAGKITVGLQSQDRKILFYVKDTGSGITDEDKKVLFTEGGRGKNSTKMNVDSTGYGLFTIQMIVDSHKGRIWEESEVGKGATFFLELPFTQDLKI